MRITILQQDIAWADPRKNLESADEAISCLPDSDLFILPEMFSTGFCMQSELVAESTDGDTLCWMRRKAAERNCAIAGSVAVSEGGRYYNRFYFVGPDGKVEHYDKRHLFAYGGEHRCFTAGSERTVVMFRGMRILLAVCYDLRFPVWSRNRGDYDLVVYVANWPASRAEAWNTLLRARAIENQCYVAGVNRVGKDPACEYAGDSVLIDPYGRTMAACPRHAASYASARIDLTALRRFREKFPVWADADPFVLG